MSMESLLITLLIGAIAGWLAGMIVKGFGFGLLGNIVIGIIGAVVAGWLLPQLNVNIGSPGMVREIINAVIGAVLVLLIIGMIKRA
jgi:uncharacterized membrane protein YeaQ/YmgE (transglycosylase-associated protein family)